MSELQGATRPPAERERVSTPGQFAALWNGMTRDAQQELLSAMARSTDEALRCLLENHDDELLAARGRLTAVMTVHQCVEQPHSSVLWCDEDGSPWPCQTARAAGVPSTDTEQLDAAKRIRAVVDATYSRTQENGRINAAHVAAETTLRDREGLPGWIAELDGPGRFR